MDCNPDKEKRDKPLKLTYRQLALCILSGLLVALAFSSSYTGWLIWIAFIPYFYVLYSDRSHWEIYLKASFFFGMAMYIGVVHWLPELHPLTWLAGVTYAQSLIIVYGGVLFISLIVSSWIWLFGLALAFLKPTGMFRLYYPVLLWMIVEWLQGLGDVSLPWGRLAVSQYQNLPLLQIVNVTGSIFISGLIIAVNVGLTLLLLDWVQHHRFHWKLHSIRALAVISGLLISIYIYGFARIHHLSATKEPFTATVVQGNISQGEKWVSKADYWQAVQRIKDIYLDLTKSSISRVSPQLIVWPESAIPILLKANGWLEVELGALANQTGAYLFTGIFDRIPETGQLYNAAVLITPNGQTEGWYYKRQLVPFGEFMPFRGFLSGIPGLGALIEKINPLGTDTAKGLTAGNVSTPLGNFGSLICFESVYPHVARESVLAGAELLLIITNDGWYKDAVAVYQHNAHAVLRAIENDRYIVRAANTGVSSLIDNRGQILDITAPLVRTTLTGTVQPITTLTPYTRWGEWVVYISLVLVLVLFGWGKISNRHSGQSPS